VYAQRNAIDSVKIQGIFIASESFGDYHCIASSHNHGYAHQAAD
jgi:hypothetical protein